MHVFLVFLRFPFFFSLCDEKDGKTCFNIKNMILTTNGVRSTRLRVKIKSTLSLSLSLYALTKSLTPSFALE